MDGHILEEYLNDRIRACAALADEAEDDVARETYASLALEYEQQKARIKARDGDMPL